MKLLYSGNIIEYRINHDGYIFVISVNRVPSYCVTRPKLLEYKQAIINLKDDCVLKRRF